MSNDDRFDHLNALPDLETCRHVVEPDVVRTGSSFIVDVVKSTDIRRSRAGVSVTGRSGHRKQVCVDYFEDE